MYEIKWTKKANDRYVQTLKFWIEHNKSTVYSEKIKNETRKVLSLIKSNYNIGRRIEINNENVFQISILRKFKIYYQVNRNLIIIIAFWSNYQIKE